MLDLEIFLSSDQPTTCPKCGNRTEIILDLWNTPEKTQHHLCPSKNCNFKFLVESEIEEEE